MLALFVITKEIFVKRKYCWKSKILSVLLSIFLFAQIIVPCGIVGDLSTDVNASELYVDAIQVTTENSNEAIEVASVPVLFSETIFTGTFGEQLKTMSTLTEAERLNAYEIYKQFAVYKVGSGTLVFNLPRVDGLSNDGVRKSAQLAKDAISRDFPEKFWLIGATSFYYWQNGRIEYSDLIYDKYKPTDDYLAKFNYAVENFEIEGSTRYEKIKSIHDTLCKNNNYNLEGTYAHEAYAGLVDFESVCEGYAKAMKVICDREGIPCILVNGTSYTSENDGGGAHMWNYVQMEDGKWYAIDATWDDQDSGTYYDFFLVGSQTVPKHFSPMKFSESHVQSGFFSGTDYGEFAYPELSETAYDSKDVSKPTQNPEITETPMPTESVAPSEVPEVTETPMPTESVAPSDVPVEINTPTPTEIVPVDSFYYADVDKNGTVTAEDALFVLKHVVKLQMIEDETAKALADVNQDSVIDATDALETLKMVVKLRELVLWNLLSF